MLAQRSVTQQIHCSPLIHGMPDSGKLGLSENFMAQKCFSCSNRCVLIRYYFADNNICLINL